MCKRKRIVFFPEYPCLVSDPLGFVSGLLARGRQLLVLAAGWSFPQHLSGDTSCLMLSCSLSLVQSLLVAQGLV